MPPTVACSILIFTSGMLELGQLLLDRLDRAADVGPQDDVERLHLLAAQAIEQVFERDVRRRAAQRRPGGSAPAAWRRSAGPGRCRRARRSARRLAERRPGPSRSPASKARLRDGGVAVERVVHRLDAAVGRAADDGVADLERAVLHEQLGDHAAAFVHLGLQAGADGRRGRDWP